MSRHLTTKQKGHEMENPCALGHTTELEAAIEQYRGNLHSKSTLDRLVLVTASALVIAGVAFADMVATGVKILPLATGSLLAVLVVATAGVGLLVSIWLAMRASRQLGQSRADLANTVGTSFNRHCIGWIVTDDNISFDLLCVTFNVGYLALVYDARSCQFHIPARDAKKFASIADAIYEATDHDALVLDAYMRRPALIVSIP